MAVASRYALPGHVLGDALGMIPLGYAAAFEGADVVSGVVVAAILFSLISLFFSFFYSQIMQRMSRLLPTLHLASFVGDTQDYSEWDAVEDPLAPHLHHYRSSSASRSASALNNNNNNNNSPSSTKQRSQSPNNNHDSPLRSASAGRSASANTNKTNASVSVVNIIPITKQPPMNLCEREATVVKLALRDAPFHVEKLSGVQMAELIQGFIGLVAREAEVYGGLVLRVMGTEATVGFNCHHIQNFHVLGAAKFYFAVQRAVNDKLRVWCPDDDPSRPQLIGALVSGASLAIGYIGTAEARSVQHLGIGEMLLQNLIGLAEHFGAQFLTTRQTAGQLQLQVDFSRKTFEADRTRRSKARDRVIQTLLSSTNDANKANAAELAAAAATPKSKKGGRSGSAKDRSASANSADSIENPAERLVRERKNKEMESFAAFFAELDDPSADADIVLMHSLRVREIDGVSITLPAYHRDRFRAALDHDGVPVSSTPYERDLSVFEVITTLAQDDMTRFNKEIENLLRGPASALLLASQTGGAGPASGFGQYCLTHPNDAVAQRMKFVNSSRNPTSRNVRFITPLGVGLRRVELRLVQVAANARGDDSDYDDDEFALFGDSGSRGEKPTSPAEALRRAAAAAGLKPNTNSNNNGKDSRNESGDKTKPAGAKREEKSKRKADEVRNNIKKKNSGGDNDDNNNNQDDGAEISDDDQEGNDDLLDLGDDVDSELLLSSTTDETKKSQSTQQPQFKVSSPTAADAAKAKNSNRATRQQKNRTNSAAALLRATNNNNNANNNSGGGGIQSEAVIQKIQNKDKYTLYFTDL